MSQILKTSTRCEAVFKLNFNCVYIYCATFVGFDFCAVNWSQLPRPGRGSCPVSLPAGRGQSGAQIEAGHSLPAPAPSATATPHWRTLSGLEGAWINTDTRTTMRILITSKHRHGQTFTFQHIQTRRLVCIFECQTQSRKKCFRGMLMWQYTHNQTQSNRMYTNRFTVISLSTHTLCPPTLCKSLAAAPINLDETTPWQGEAFIPFPGG